MALKIIYLCNIRYLFHGIEVVVFLLKVCTRNDRRRFFVFRRVSFQSIKIEFN